jgi:hypothetical protein
LAILLIDRGMYYTSQAKKAAPVLLKETRKGTGERREAAACDTKPKLRAERERVSGKRDFQFDMMDVWSAIVHFTSMIH